MKNFRQIFFKKYSENKSTNEDRGRFDIPDGYDDLIGDFNNVYLSEQIWFPYTRDGKEHEYCISTLYGMKDMPREINDWIEAFDDPYEELFFYGLIPFATEDGHTGLAFKNTEGSKKSSVHFVDYEWQEYYDVSNSYEEFINKCFIKSYEYTYEVSEVTENLMNIISEWLKVEMSVNEKFDFKSVEENMLLGTLDLFREDGKVAIGLNNNRYKDHSGYRECIKKDAKIILSILPNGQVTDDLSLEEKEKYKKINDELCKLDIITPVRTHGKLMISDICRL